MPEPVFTLGFLAGFTALYATARSGSTVSAEAEAIQERAQAVLAISRQSIALFGEQAKALSQIAGLAAECAEPDWDGYDARPLDPIAARNASELIRAFPPGIPLPEFAAEPDGSISLDWISARNRLVSASVGRTNRIAYAWLDGSDKGHAVAGFNGLQFPPRLLQAIHSIVNHADTSLWAA